MTGLGKRYEQEKSLEIYVLQNSTQILQIEKYGRRELAKTRNVLENKGELLSFPADWQRKWGSTEESIFFALK